MIEIQDVKTLVKQCSGNTLSLYLQVNPALEENQADTPAWRIYVKNALRDISRQADHDEQRAVWDDIQQRVTSYLADYEPGGKGLAMFYCEEFEQVYELPVMPHQNMWRFGKPMVAPLLWLIDEYEHYLIVLADSEEAHFLTTYMGNVERQEAMASDRFTFDFREKTLMPRQGSPVVRGQAMGGQITEGSHRDIFDDKIKDHISRFHNDVARRIRELDVPRVIIGGTEKAAHAVYERLHESVRQSVVSVMSIPMHLTDYEVFQRALPVALEYEREQEMELVNQVIDFAMSGGRGALGYDDVKRTLDMQQVEMLVAAFPPKDENILHDLTLQVLESGGRIELLHDTAAEKLQQHDGIAARLYYPITETTS